MKAKNILWYVFLLVALTTSQAFGAIDVALVSQDTVSEGETFDLEIRMSGTDKTLAFDLYVNFDKDKVRIASITPEAEGIFVPSQEAIDNANEIGRITIVYLDMALEGFSPGEDSLMATFTCEAIAQGEALFEIDESSNIAGEGHPSPDIMGNLTGKSVGIVGDVPDETWHSADFSRNFRIELTELLRVIQLFTNDAYHCQAGSEDGFAPGTGDQNCTPHASDYNPQNWRIELSELLRLIQLFNNEDGYRVEENTEDGFTPN